MDQGWAELRWDGTPEVSVPSWSLWMQPGGPIEAADMTRLVWGAVGGMVRRRMKSVSVWDTSAVGPDKRLW